MAAPDYIQQMRDELLRQFKKDFGAKENFDKLLQSIGAATSDLGDTIEDMILKRGLTTAEGAQLDIIGAIVGQPRGDENDVDYLELIELKIFINTGDASQIVLNTVFKIISESTFIKYFPNSESPAQATLFGNGPKVNNLLTRQFMGLVKGAGVRLYLQHNSGRPFAMANSDGTLHTGYGTFQGIFDHTLDGSFVTQFEATPGV